MQTLIIAVIALPVMLVLDLLWIGVIGGSFYASQLGSALRPDVLWPVAILFYGIYAGALAFFVVKPALETHSVTRAVLSAAFFGLTAYAAYNLTNLATLTGWPIPLTVIDLLWGVIVTVLTSVATYFIASKFLKA